MLVFWAYVGFELTTVPAREVRDPARTIPRAMACGMAIVSAFHLATIVVLYALVPQTALVDGPTPLALAGTALFGTSGAALIAAGAMVSVSGSDESDILGSSRLAYAMAADGLLPHRLAALRRRFGTPYIALAAQAAIAIPLTFFDGIADLISFSVFNLAFSFLLRALALVRLQRAFATPPRLTRRALPFLAIAIDVGLIVAVSDRNQVYGSLVILIGACIYAVAAPGRALPTALEQLLEVERQLMRLAHRRMRFLGGPIGWLGGRRTPDRGKRSLRGAGSSEGVH